MALPLEIRISIKSNAVRDKLKYQFIHFLMVKCRQQPNNNNNNNNEKRDEKKTCYKQDPRLRSTHAEAF